MRSTSATRLHKANVQEQLVKEVTGHNSNAVRLYKHTDDKWRQEVSNKLHEVSNEGAKSSKCQTVNDDEVKVWKLSKMMKR